MNALARLGGTRIAVVLLAALAVFLPIGLVFWQSALSGPFFFPNHEYGWAAYQFIFDDPDFWMAAKNSLMIAVGMIVIALPLGAALAFLLSRTDLPGRRWIEVLVLIPVFVSPFVLGFGYVVATGPVGFYSLMWQSWFGSVPWNIYSLPSIAIIAGLTHVPHVYLYSSAALKNLGSDVEEAARVTGAGPLRVARSISLPMVAPSLLYSGVLVFFLGFEIFGLPLILGDPEGHLVLATYLYKLTNKLGLPSYHLMAAVAVCIIAVTFPLVLLQRHLLKTANRYIAVKGKATRQRLMPLGRWRWMALALVGGWLFVTVVVPLSGITLRAFVTNWGLGVQWSEAFTLQHFRDLAEQPGVIRAIFNTILIGVIGGGLAVACYTALGLVAHRRSDILTRCIDYMVLIPRAVPGLLAGLAFLWVFLFIPGLKELRSSLFSVWLAYAVVWLAYGMRLVSSALLQVAPELEESARTLGASRTRVNLEITLPLIRFGLLASWLLVFMIFEREYSTGVYLLTPGTEVIGSMLVSQWAAGAVDLVAVLSLTNVLLVGTGIAIALKLGVKLHD
ncbi:ABC transporter permease [Leeia aquatica]|uniref:Iron ABC transporter permease n=1 Tax=Leeia aquatica TaxID=2725557 RepID=A0A847S234_9NEIS|nr:iron ABC transporter permease [Leeia aquatica]NLR75891.1 iron ABC transporter permease [Leeia aquatica]